MRLQPIAERGLLVQDQRHETDREQHEPGQTQRGRTRDEQQGHSDGADHSAIWQQLSNAHWRGIIWRRPHAGEAVG